MRFLFKSFLFVLIVAVGVAVAGSTFWDRMHDAYRGYAGEEQFVDIPSGSSTRDIGRRLVAAGVVQDETTFRAALWWSNQGRRLKAGEYRFDHALTPFEVIDRIARGDAYARRITFPEGLTIAEMAKIYEAKELGPAAEFAQAARDVALVRDLDPAARDLEGYLFPETYSLPRGTPAAKLVAMMVDRFKVIYTATPGALETTDGLTLRQVMTLASLIEKETASPDERPLVSAVYRNRLRIRMPLQADPTIVFALAKAGRYDGNIRRDDLAIESPYNTYKYPGLPPGPIAAPGKASLEAALAPAAVPYLYFVSKNDGSHVFAASLAEHNRNVQKFQVEFFREQRRRRN